MLPWILGGVSVAGSIIGGIEANRASAEQEKRNQEEALYRYRVQSKIAEQQMNEQDQLAFEKMTETTRKFLVAKSQLLAQQGETGVAGKSAQRMKNTLNLKLSEEKGNIAREANLNKINIANDMLGKKIDTEANMARAMNQRKSTLSILTGAVEAGVSGYQLGSSIETTDTYKKLFG